MPRHYVRGLGGALLGGVLGTLLYWLLLSRGYIVPLLAPGLIGLGAGLAMDRRCWGMGVIAAVLGLATAILADGLLRPFPEHPGLWYFVTHLHQCDPFRFLGLAVPMVVIYLIGTLAAFYFGVGRNYLSNLGGA